MLLYWLFFIKLLNVVNIYFMNIKPNQKNNSKSEFFYFKKTKTRRRVHNSKYWQRLSIAVLFRCRSSVYVFSGSRFGDCVGWRASFRHRRSTRSVASARRSSGGHAQKQFQILSLMWKTTIFFIVFLCKYIIIV